MLLKIFKILSSIIIIAMMLILALIWFWKNDAFELRAVKIQGNRFLPQEEIFELAGIDFARDVFEVDTDAIERKLRTCEMIEKVSVSRFLPSTIKIKVLERELIAAMSGSEVSAVDIGGNIISRYPPAAIYDLPVITGVHFRKDSSRGTQESEPPDPFHDIINILKKIKSRDILLYCDISEIHYSQNNGIVVYLKRSNLPVILGKDYYHRKVIYFSTIYHYLLEKNNLNQALVIDVRFKDQVVVKQKS